MGETGEQQAGDQKREPNIRRRPDKTGDNDGPGELAGAAPPQAASQRPRRPRPLRPGQFRMVAVAAAGHQQRNTGEHVPIIETIGPQALLSSGAPVESRIEIASSVLQSAGPGRATLMPPKRPNYPPTLLRHYVAQPSAYAVHAHGLAKSGNSVTNQNQTGANNPSQHQLHHPRFQPTTSLGATALTPSSSNKPNRYSWAQMQQWHAAAAASAQSATAMVALDATGAPVEAAAVGGGAGNASGQAANSASGFHYHLPTPFSTAASRVLFVPNPIVNLSEHTKSRLVKFIEAIKRFSEKWFSHVLLLMFLASYACLGAYVFISFEAPNEQWEKQLIIDTRLRIVNESYDKALELGSRELFVDVFRQRFEDYERLLNRACASGMTSSSLENQWTFWGALFYSMTVFTTIGYGHLTPITFAGRVATMIYAIFGIPILLMVLADLGKLLTRIIKYAFKRFRSIYNKCLGRKATVRTRKLIQDNTNQYIGQARHAFERGFATYIQPYQARLPHAFQSRSLHNRDGTQLVVGASGQQVLNLDEHLESSDVIVTPPKQTEPVSPQPETVPDTCQREASPLASIPTDGNTPNGNQQGDSSSSTNNNHNHNEHKHKNKDKSKRTRKTSSQQLKATETCHNQRRASQRQANVARSSSTTDIEQASCAGGAPQGDSNQKRASLDNQPNPAVVVESSFSSQQDNSLNKQLDHDNHHHDEHQHEHEHLESGLEQDDCQEEDFLDELDEDLDIPVSFALFLLITYMMFGAVVFSIWESWNFFDSLYFVFISMSTIGFGDLVPQHPKRMIGTFAYLLFGLALTSMCINVVQEKIHATFLRAKMQIGEKMGFDLNQIMADDYYHDGGSAFGGDDSGEEQQLDENGSIANSVALSQTNSTTMTGSEQIGAGLLAGSQAEQRNPGQQVATAAQQAADSSGGPLATAPISRSKSRESLKWKKRSLSGAFGASLSLPDQHAGASSCRRKMSPGARKISTTSQTRHGQQAAPTQQTNQQQLLQSQSQQNSAPPANKEIAAEPTTTSVPIKHHIETIRMLNVPVMLQQLEEKAPSAAQNRQQQSRLNPSINQPIDGGIKAFCEPLRRAFQGGGDQNRRARLVASRSQPSSPYQQLADSQHNIDRASMESGAGSRPFHEPNSGQRYASNRPGLAHLNGHRGRDAAQTRSLACSRRGSVSDELHQLDDLIVALSKTPPERFGPLLGIPSSRRSSRSNSPLVTGASRERKPAHLAATGLVVAAASGGGGGGGGGGGISRSSGASPRRGASLMVRGSNESVLSAGRRTPLGRQDKRLGTSFGSTTTSQTPPFMTPSGSSNLLASASVDQQRGAAGDGQRRKSSSSSNASRFVLARQSQNELEGGQSQAALDELEAGRF